MDDMEAPSLAQLASSVLSFLTGHLVITAVFDLAQVLKYTTRAIPPIPPNEKALRAHGAGM